LSFIDVEVEKAIQNKQIPGAVVAIGRKGKLAFLKAYGNKQIEPNIVPMDVDGLFKTSNLYPFSVHYIRKNGALHRLVAGIAAYSKADNTSDSIRCTTVAVCTSCRLCPKLPRSSPEDFCRSRRRS
jgi:hypothetical protein